MAPLTDLNEREQIQNRFERKKPQKLKTRSHVGCHGWEGGWLGGWGTDANGGDLGTPEVGGFYSEDNEFTFDQVSPWTLKFIQ